MAVAGIVGRLFNCTIGNFTIREWEYAHRYRECDRFRNPSVYCADLKKLIYHIESRVRADIDAAINT
ncbi:hypothetical protein ACQP0C_31010 [Nocardia sp. CA-129566]|uniref:hypothetical protein n=1 Tax=Nocardia sp. CA-129566 TaxID=3239976 RepID=UPI003D9783FC